MEIITGVNRLCRFVATLGPIGYLPMPGTCGTLCAVPLLYVLQRGVCTYWWCNERFMTLLFVVIAWWFVDRALRTFGWEEHDPQVIVLDEMVGFCVAVVGLPWNPFVLALAFIYFRFFDIVKPLGLHLLDQLPGATGILIDDVAAGLLAHMFTSWTLALTAWI